MTSNNLALLPLLEELRQRIEAIETRLGTPITETDKEKQDRLDMAEIQDYLAKIHMA